MKEDNKINNAAIVKIKYSSFLLWNSVTSIFDFSNLSISVYISFKELLFVALKYFPSVKVAISCSVCSSILTSTSWYCIPSGVAKGYGAKPSFPTPIV